MPRRRPKLKPAEQRKRFIETARDLGILDTKAAQEKGLRQGGLEEADDRVPERVLRTSSSALMRTSENPVVRGANDAGHGVRSKPCQPRNRAGLRALYVNSIGVPWDKQSWKASTPFEIARRRCQIICAWIGMPCAIIAVSCQTAQHPKPSGLPTNVQITSKKNLAVEWLAAGLVMGGTWSRLRLEDLAPLFGRLSAPQRAAFYPSDGSASTSAGSIPGP